MDTIGSKYDKTAYQVAMNWILRQESIVTIPKAVNKKHIDDNLKTLDWELDKEDLDQIENYFPQ
ncbi:aldo/keto reductase [Paenibacillus sp. J45TS6]|uniref:aldo/keto reductase n=1 Tax=Paenibacillus sp. J45TS6 TaxID=2807196 RepID=UPI0035B55F7B